MVENLTPQVTETPARLAVEHVNSLASARGLRVAYIMSRFPKLTETFILYEILALEEQGAQVELFPLLRASTKVMHPEAGPLVERAHFQPFLSWQILRAQLRFLRRNPRLYLRTLWAVLRGTWGSLNFFVGGLGIFPKSVYFAELVAAAGIRHIHAHFANHPTVAAFIINRLTGIPYSFTAHGSDLHVDRHMLCEKVEVAALVVTISNYNQALIREECSKESSNKVVVIHCGVDTQVFQPRPGVVRSMDAGGPFSILCTGTLHEVKGQSYLVEACRLLDQRGIDFVCHLVGEGADQAMLTDQIGRAGLSNRVLLHGRRTREQIADLLATVDVVVAPSVPTKSGKREGIPVVLMEAMSSGVPVVASRISGIPELVEHGSSGLLAPPRDAKALAEALEQLHADPVLRQRLGQAGRATVLREFDLATNAALLAQRFTTEASL